MDDTMQIRSDQVSAAANCGRALPPVIRARLGEERRPVQVAPLRRPNVPSTSTTPNVSGSGAAGLSSTGASGTIYAQCSRLGWQPRRRDPPPELYVHRSRSGLQARAGRPRWCGLDTEP